jgi:hypothetical protein
MTDLISRGREDRYAHPWLAELVFALDARLRHRYQVIEYTSDPECIFRVHMSQSEQSFELADGTAVRPGDRLLNVHLWNEHIPAVPAAGPTIVWARRFYRHLELSVRHLARYCVECREVEDVVAIGANLVQATREQRTQLTSIMGRFGFAPPRGRKRHHAERDYLEAPLRRLGENILISAMVLAQNPVVFRTDSLWRVRTPVFVSRAALIARYGEAGHAGMMRAATMRPDAETA